MRPSIEVKGRSFSFSVGLFLLYPRTVSDFKADSLCADLGGTKTTCFKIGSWWIRFLIGLVWGTGFCCDLPSLLFHDLSHKCLRHGEIGFRGFLFSSFGYLFECGWCFLFFLLG